MGVATRTKLVTLQGECLDVEYEGERRAIDRDGVFHNFQVTDLARARGLLRVSVFRGGPRDAYVPTIAEYDSREYTVVLNMIRRAFDRGDLNFEVHCDSSSYKEIRLQPLDFAQHPLKKDAEIRAYMIHKAFWLSYRYPVAKASEVLYPIQFDETLDLEYLGANVPDVLRNILRLKNQGLLDQVLEANARPSERLLRLYESGDYVALGLHSGTAQVLAGESDDRKFARLAIEEALKSVPEDGRPHPRVGAIVVKNGRILSRAHRGENPKSHAEYAALDMKLSHDLIAGSTVYTTLEPCTTRKHPKIPCAQRLIDRKVARVVIGMLDPNPDIRGRGDQLLSDAGIETQLFPRDLRAQVEEMNREFIRSQKDRQALGKMPTIENNPVMAAARSLTDATRNLQKAAWSFYGLYTRFGVAQAARDVANEEKEILKEMGAALNVFSQDYDFPADLLVVAQDEMGKINIALANLKSFSMTGETAEMEIAATQIQDACERVRNAAKPYAYRSGVS